MYSTFAQGSAKKNAERRKHFALSITIQMPSSDEKFNIDTNTSIKVKQLKELILKRINDPALADVSVDRIQLQIDGGDYLKKNSALLDEAGVRNHSHLLVSVSDKSTLRGASNTQSGLERRRSGRDEPKLPIIYTLRNPSALSNGVAAVEGNPESNGGAEMIDASGAKPNLYVRKGRIEIVAFAKLKQLRQAIKDDLGIKDKVNIKLILPVDKEAQKALDKEETKEGDEVPLE